MNTPRTTSAARPFARWLLGLLVMVGPGLSRAAADDAAATFRLLSTAGSHSDLQYEVAPGKPPVRIHLNQSVSRNYPRPANGILSLFREIAPPPGSPQGTPSSRQNVLTLALPEKTIGDLVVTAPKDRDFSTRELIGRVLPGNARLDTAGTLRVLNLSSHAVGMMIGTRLHEFVPGVDTRVPLPPQTVRVLFRVAVQDQKSRWTQVQKNERRLSPYHRGYLVVTDYIDDPDYGKTPDPPPIRIQLFFEFDPAARLAARK